MDQDAITGTGVLSGYTIDNAYGTGGHGLRDSVALLHGSNTLVANSYTYESATGRLSSASQGSHAARYSYTANTDWVGSVAHQKNSSSLFTQRTHRDLGGQVLGVISRGGAAASGAVLVNAGYAIDSKGRRTRLTREDGTRWEFGYNNRDELTSGKKRESVSGGLLAGQQYEYAYDDIGNRITAKFGGDESGAALRTIGYTANSTNQYSTITHPGHVQIVGYSDSTEPIEASSNIAGSPLSQVGSTTVQGNRWRAEVLNSAANGAWEDLKVEQEVSGTPTSIGGGKLWIPPSSASPTYDGDGNLRYDGRWNYEWDGENRLIKMETAANALTAGHPWMRLSFKYDYMGRRIEKRVETGSPGSSTLALKHIFLYDGWNVIAEINTIPTNAQTVATYLWGTDLSGSEQGAGGVGGLLLCHSDTDSDGDVDSNDTAHIPAYDGNGNIIAWLDDTANVVVRMDYSPFGQTISKFGNVAGLYFGFSTKYQDEETGLCYYGYRYYDPETGRWLNRDPIEEQGGVNLYGFVGNDGVNVVDVLGRDPFYGPNIPGFGLPGFGGDPYSFDDDVNDSNEQAHTKKILKAAHKKAGAKGKTCIKQFLQKLKGQKKNTTLDWIALNALKKFAYDNGSYAHQNHSPGSEEGTSAFPKNTWKCNKFVSDVHTEIVGGATNPGPNQPGFPLQQGGGTWPPQANQLANVSFGNLSDPQDYNKGDPNPVSGSIITWPCKNDSGHTGISVMECVVNAREFAIVIEGLEELREKYASADPSRKTTHRRYIGGE